MGRISLLFQDRESLLSCFVAWTLLISRDHPSLQCTRISTGSFHWISGSPPPDLDEGLELLVQVRHRMTPVPANVILGQDGQSYVVVAIFHDAEKRVDIVGWRLDSWTRLPVLLQDRCWRFTKVMNA